MGLNLKIIASGNTANVKWISDAILFEQLIHKVRELISGAKNPTVQQNASNDIPDQIKKLADLFESGVLTEAEFQTKKQELLDRL